MVLSYTAWLSLRPVTEQPCQVASAAQVEPLTNPGDRHRRPGSLLTGQSRLARTTFPATRQILLRPAHPLSSSEIASLRSSPFITRSCAERLSGGHSLMPP